MRGDCSYHPSLYRKVSECDANASALELTSDGKPIGLMALSGKLATDIAMYSGPQVRTLDDMLACLVTHLAANTDHASVESTAVSGDMWQAVATEQDRVVAEAKA